MVPFLYSPREHHGVTSVEEYRASHAAFIARKRARGGRADVHDSPEPIVARVDANTWLVDCDCGNGCATDPAWALACCYGCGAIHTAVQFPDVTTRQHVEAVLLARRRTRDRCWNPAAEDLESLVNESLAAGLPVPADVRAALASRGRGERS